MFGSPRKPEEDNSKPHLVAMKTLQSNANEAAKADFNHEIRIMDKLRHENIVQVSADSSRAFQH